MGYVAITRVHVAMLTQGAVPPRVLRCNYNRQIAKGDRKVGVYFAVIADYEAKSKRIIRGRVGTGLRDQLSLFFCAD